MGHLPNYDNWKLKESPSETNPFENRIGETVDFWVNEKGIIKNVLGIVVDTDVTSVTLEFCGNKTVYLLDSIRRNND